MEAEWDFTDDLPHTDEFGVTRRNVRPLPYLRCHRSSCTPQRGEPDAGAPNGWHRTAHRHAHTHVALCTAYLCSFNTTCQTPIVGEFYSAASTNATSVSARRLSEVGGRLRRGGQATQKEIPEEHRDPWEPRIEEYGEMEGRVEYEDGFHVGQVVEGIVEALTERQGIFVDVGADYDANVFVDEFDWDKIAPLITIDQKVKIKVGAKTLRDSISISSSRPKSCRPCCRRRDCGR